MKQIYHSVGLPIKRHFEETHLLVAFYHKFKDFVQLSVTRDD